MISLEFLTKLMLNGETNLTCITVTSQCDQYVAMVINHWHQKKTRYIIDHNVTFDNALFGNMIFYIEFVKL